jgi:hypothetical protein
MDAGTPTTISSTAITGYIQDPSMFSQHDDLLAITDWINATPKAEVNAYFGKQSNAFFEKYADSVYEPEGIIFAQGLTKDERLKLFDAMASKYEGGLLARETVAFDRQPGDVIDIGKAVANDANRVDPKDKLAFIRGIARDVAGPELVIEGGNIWQSPNEAGVAAATVLASLKGHPVELDAAITALKDAGKLKAVEEAALGLQISAEGGLIYNSPADNLGVRSNFSYDVHLLQDVVDAVRQSGNGASCAVLAESLGELLRDVRGDTAGATFPGPTDATGRVMARPKLGLPVMIEQLERDAAQRRTDGPHISR